MTLGGAISKKCDGALRGRYLLGLPVVRELWGGSSGLEVNETSCENPCVYIEKALPLQGLCQDPRRGVAAVRGDLHTFFDYANARSFARGCISMTII